MNEDAIFIREKVQEHTRWFRDSIPLIASENLMSPLAQELLISDFENRYAEGNVGKRYYEGCRYIDEVEQRCMDMTKKIFRANYVDVRLISGTVANLAVIKALTKPGDKVTALPTPAGAHISHGKMGAVGVRGLELSTYPWNDDEFNIDIDGTKKLLKEVQPKIAIFGASLFLFPEPIREMDEICRSLGIPIVYDAAHVLGLIGAGLFQDALREGAKIITSSTHKTFPGPQGGLILAEIDEGDEDELKMEKKLNRAVFPGLVSNHHLNRLAAYGITLAEFEEFGEDYVRQIVKNSKALGEAMHSLGFKVLCEDKGFTESHQLAIDFGKPGEGSRISKLFEANNIITNCEMLPWDDPKKPMNPSGIRIGVQELTRIGMKPGEMKAIAEIMKEAVDGKDVRNMVKEIRRDFNTVHYCFNKLDAHTYRKIVP